MTLKVAFIGCVEFSEIMLNTLKDQPGIEIVGVVTRQASTFNADFRSLEPLADEIGCPVHLADGNDQGAIADVLRDVAPDLVYCFGWSYLLGEQVRSIPRLGVVGYHPAALPKNRGRHPIIWALALGLSETASTFFLMDEGADSGDIVSQVEVPIAFEDTARTLYDKLADVAKAQLADMTARFVAGTVQPRPQDSAQANTWRKRGPADGRIDWRMGAETIYNLVRALSEPYVGAHIEHAGQNHTVWKAALGPDGPDVPANLEPGLVLGVENGVTVKCAGGSIVLQDIEPALDVQPGDYL